jgi:hypothetical protein
MDRTDLDKLAKAIKHTDWRSTPEQLQGLTDAWKMAKRMKDDWAEQQLVIESEIYQLVEKQLPEKGTHTLDTGMKIVTGHSEEWDQPILSLAYEKWAAPVPFPFTGVWKPDGKAIAYLREKWPETYEKIRPALTLKPKKPSFSVKEG